MSDSDKQITRTANHALAILNDMLAQAAKTGLRCHVETDRREQFVSDVPIVTLSLRISREVSP